MRPGCRPAASDEVGDLQELYRRSSLHHETFRQALLAHPEWREPTDEQVADGQVRVLEADGRPLGFTTVVPDGEVAELEALFVEPDAMGAGAGRLLVEDAVEQALGAGLSRMEVTANPDAVDFYAHLGFVAVGEAQTELGPALRMRRTLP